MPEARLAVSVPAGVWMEDVSTAHPDATFHVVSVLSGEDNGIVLVRLETGDPLPVLTELDALEDVVDVDLLWKRDDEALLQLETTSQALLVPLWRAGVPIEMPFSVTDGVATWEISTSPERFSALGEHLEAAGVAYDVEYVQEIGADPAAGVLTERQREVLLAALQLGYYDTPREATLTEVAEALDVSKATCSDVLHRAEGNLVAWFADEHLAGHVGGGHPAGTGSE